MKSKKILLITSIVSGAIAVFVVVYPLIMTAYFETRFAPEEADIKWNDDASVGIIGGADGSTAILISGGTATSLSSWVLGMIRYGFAALFTVITAVTAVLFYKLCKEGKNQ